MKVPTQPYKGARDFYPEDKRIQLWMFSKWRKVVERYGYEEYDAPILEPTDLYLMKGSEEIIKEQTYTFLDRGDRSVTIRTEMTPSVSRMVAGKRQELVYPLRWYSIPNLWRYERMQRGRLREFWQLNVDMFGVSSMQAELEMIQIIDDLFQAVKAKRTTYTIKINSRVLVNSLLQGAGIEHEKALEVIRLVDKINKMSLAEFQSALLAIVVNEETARLIMSALVAKSIADLPEELQKHESAITLQKLIDSAQAQGISNVVFEISLMRGFDYYTDIVFEVFDTGGDNNRSIAGGGRYDGLVGQFGAEPIPTVGFAMGDVVFADYLRTYKLLPEVPTRVEVMLLLLSDVDEGAVQLIARKLREENVSVAVDYSGKKADKQYKNALKTGVKFAIFVGPKELENGQFVLKNLASGIEKIHSIERIVSIVKDHRSSK